jgi:hypothetical protein
METHGVNLTYEPLSDAEVFSSPTDTLRSWITILGGKADGAFEAVRSLPPELSAQQAAMLPAAFRYAAALASDAARISTELYRRDLERRGR